MYRKKLHFIALNNVPTRLILTTLINLDHLSAVDSVRPRTFAKPIVTYRHALQSINEYQLEQVNLY